MKILIAVDGSDYTRRAIEYVMTHPWIRSCDGITVFAVALAVPHRAAAMAGPALTHDYYEDDAELALGPVREAFRAAGIQAKFEWAVGHPGKTIAAKASREQFDLIVMGSHGHTVLANALLGSAATQVLAECKVPVLLLR